MTAAWNARGLPHTSKLVLLALADNANDAGICWPSIPKVAERCSLDERTVYRAIATLEGCGHVTTQARPGKSTVYKVHPNVGVAGEQHYVYRTENVTTGEFYVGSRTCQGDASADAYVGSGKWVVDALNGGAPLKKGIISYHASRQEASAEEARLLVELVGMPGCMNRRAASTYTPTPDSQSPDTKSGVPLAMGHPVTKSGTPVSLSGPPTSEVLLISSGSESSRTISKSSLRSPRAPARARSRTVPTDFEVTPEMRKWAKETCPSVDIDAQTLIFRDHEFRDPHGNWPAAWRQWMRRVPEFQRNGGSGGDPQLTWRPGPEDC